MTDAFSPWWSWLRCVLAPDLSDRQIMAIDARYTLPTFIDNIDDIGHALGLSARCVRAIKNPDGRVLDRQQLWLLEDHRHLIAITDARYPLALRMTEQPPLLLWVMGDAKHLSRKQIAMVGSRKASYAGAALTRDWAGLCVAQGWVVTSGLALGIDAAAHQGALAAGGPTIAVLGSALDRIYPATHQSLAKQIMDQGCVVSQWPLGVGPKRGHFPQRNAVISGLSLGVVVMEANLKSGSLITARLAGEQGRDVFAVPGSVLHPLSAGCHHLIRNGAKCVSHINDIFEEFSCMDGAIKVQTTVNKAPRMRSTLAPDAKLLLQCVDTTPTALAEVMQRLPWPADKIFSIINELEVCGRIKQCPGGYFRV